MCIPVVIRLIAFLIFAAFPVAGQPRFTGFPGCAIVVIPGDPGDPELRNRALVTCYHRFAGRYRYLPFKYRVEVTGLPPVIVTGIMDPGIMARERLCVLQKIPCPVRES
jgi:hypothetical protein